MKPVVFHPLAEAEYRAAVDYYERQRPGLGLAFQEEIERAVEEIQKDPLRCPPYDDNEVRQCIARGFPYSILYADLEARIWIAAVAHHKRKPGYWARRRP